MSNELRLKKLRGSGGYIIANVDDGQQRKGSLGGPDLFLAPVGRLDSEKITKYYCNTCEKEYEGSPKIDYETPNEVVAENLILLEKGQYICTTCGSILAEYRNFSKPDEKAEVGAAKPEVAAQDTYMPPMNSAPQQSFQTTTDPVVKTFNSITGLAVYDSEARRLGVVKEIGIQPEQSGIVLIVTKNDNTNVTIKWDDVKKIGDVVLLGGQTTDSDFKCSKCGNTNIPGSKFCESCGNKIK